MVIYIFPISRKKASRSNRFSVRFLKSAILYMQRLLNKGKEKATERVKKAEKKYVSKYLDTNELFCH